MIEGGYIMIARKIDSSSISNAPPYAREIWLYLLQTANHKDNHVCKRGQTIRRYIDIREALCWYVGYRKCMYSISQCENAMKLLVRANMIATKRTTRGLLITICNYNTYQTPANYESQNYKATASATMEPQHCHTINKNDKNVKKKEKNIGRFTPPTLSQIKDFIQGKRYAVDPNKFFNFYEAKGWMVGKNKMKNWEAAVRTWLPKDSESPKCLVCSNEGVQKGVNPQGKTVFLCEDCYVHIGYAIWPKMPRDILEKKIEQSKAKSAIRDTKQVNPDFALNEARNEQMRKLNG